MAARLGLPHGTRVSALPSKAAADALEVVREPTDLEPDPIHPDVQRSSFAVRAKGLPCRVQLCCKVDDLAPVCSEVQVLPAEPIDAEIPNGFSFHRQNYTVKEGAQKTLRVRARFTPPLAEVPPIDVHIDDPTVATLRARTGLQPIPGTTYYEGTLVVFGKQLQGRTTVRAEAGGKKASAGLQVVSKEEEAIELKFELVPYSLGENYRAAWDRQQPNKLQITTQHESISRYLGPEVDGYPGQNEAPFRVLLAELIADNVCRRIVEEHSKALPHQFDADRVYVLHNKLMKEFTPIAHKIQLADPTGST